MMEEQSYLAQSFQSAFEKHEMHTSIVNIAATSAIVNQEHPIGYLICASSELLKKDRWHQNYGRPRTEK